MLGNLRYGILAQTQGAPAAARPSTCIYTNLASMRSADNTGDPFNFGAKGAGNRSYTVAGWCQSNLYLGSSPNRYCEFFFGHGGSTWRWFPRLYETASGTKSNYQYNASGVLSFNVVSNNFALNTWYFLAVNFDDSTKIMSMYVYDINGLTMSGSTNIGGNALGQDTTDYFLLGSPGAYPSSYKHHFNATGVWNRFLTLTELLQLYNSGAGMSYANLSGGLLTNLLAWWDCTALDGNGITYDSTANGYNLTANDKTKCSVVAI